MGGASTSTARSRRARGLVAVLVALFLICGTACGSNGSGSGGSGSRPVEFGEIDQPSAVVHYTSGPQQLGNIVSRHQGAFRTDGSLAALEPSVPILGDDLDEAYFSLEFDHQYGTWMVMPESLVAGVPVPKEYFSELVSHLAVLEFTFPEATHEGMTELDWFVTPHFSCSYDFRPADFLTPTYEGGQDLFGVGFEYSIVADPLDLFTLAPPQHPMRVSEALWKAAEFENNYLLRGKGSGTILASNDDREGVMLVPQGKEAKLYLALLVDLRSSQEGDWTQIGVRDSGAPDLCTIEFGPESYYTMRPVQYTP